MQVHYRWQSDDPKTHCFRVSLSLSGCLPAQQWSLWMPVWTPGSYLVREFSRHIHDVHARLIDHEHGLELDLAVEKNTKNGWQLQTNTNIKNGQLIIEYRVYAFDTSVRAAYFDLNSLALDGAAVWLSVEGTEELPRTLEWSPPSSDTPWSLATALHPDIIDENGFGLYQAENYLHQVDTPVLAGAYLQKFLIDFENVPYTMVFDDAHTYDRPLDLERLQRDMTTILKWHQQFWPGKRPFSHYVTLTQIFANNYGGLEHAHSTRLVCSRYDLPRLGITTNEEDYGTFLGLFSHEYFHSWWVKRLRPHTLLPYALKNEQYTPLLWMFEGFTAYFDDLSLVQSGLISRERYLTILEKMLDRVLHTPARHRHTLHEASFDAWIRAYRPDENTPNSTVNYYDQGAVLALVLDLMLIEHGSSLRHVLATLWSTHAIEARQELAGLTEAHLLDVLHQQAPLVDWSAFIQSTVHNPSLPNYEHALKTVGITIEWNTPSTAQTLAQRFGVRFKDRSLVISHVLNGRVAAEAGVHVGDEWIAFNREQLNPTSWTTPFTRIDHETHPIFELHFFREGRLQTLTVNRPASLAFHQLRLNANVDATQKEASARWLHTGNTAS